MSHAVHKAKLKQSIKHGKLIPLSLASLSPTLYKCASVCDRQGALRCQVVRELGLLQFVIMKLCNGYE